MTDFTFAHHRQTMEELHRAAGGNVNTAEVEVRLRAIRETLGGAEGEEEATYTRFVREWQALWSRGCRLAEFLIVYGTHQRPPTALDLAALSVALPYAQQYRVRMDAEARVIADGGSTSPLYHSTYCGGDLAEGRRLWHESEARRQLG